MSSGVSSIGFKCLGHTQNLKKVSGIITRDGRKRCRRGDLQRQDAQGDAVQVQGQLPRLRECALLQDAPSRGRVQRVLRGHHGARGHSARLQASLPRQMPAQVGLEGPSHVSDVQGGHRGRDARSPLSCARPLQSDVCRRFHQRRRRKFARSAAVPAGPLQHAHRRNDVQRLAHVGDQSVGRLRPVSFENCRRTRSRAFSAPGAACCCCCGRPFGNSRADTPSGRGHRW